MTDTHSIEHWQTLVGDMRSLADRVESASYHSAAQDIRRTAANMEEVFIKTVCEHCGQKIKKASP